MAKKPSRCHPVGGETIGLYLAGFGHFRWRCRRCRHTAIASENNQFSRFRPLTNVDKNMILRDASDSFVAVSATFDDRMATLSSGSDLQQHGASVFCSNRSRKMYCFELYLCCPRGALILNTSCQSFATSTACASSRADTLLRLCSDATLSGRHLPAVPRGRHPSRG